MNNKNKHFAAAKHLVRYSVPHIYVARVEGKGRGVFASRPLKKGERIELCPVLVLSQHDLELIRQTQLYNYYFAWGDEDEFAGIALGFGSLYNHSYQPNARYQVDYEAETIEILCHRNIEPHEEITINYNGETDDQTPIWFDQKNTDEHPPTADRCGYTA